jgi:mannose-1-phosphate guanylyltransferase/mannose-6-phosphate isomerase
MPKQFLPLVGPLPPFQMAVQRARALCSPDRMICIANSIHGELVAAMLNDEACPARILLEECSKNTAAALACAALLIVEEAPHALVLSLPADHYVPDLIAFSADVAGARAAALDGWLVTFGVTPNRPADGYGYISPGEAIADAAPARRVTGFVEKPDEATAAALIAGGSVWNSGILFARADRLVQSLSAHEPLLMQACRDAVVSARAREFGLHLAPAAFDLCPCLSIDRAVLERDGRIAVVPFSGAWADLGSWEVLATHGGHADGTSRTDGEVQLLDCDNVYVRSGERPVVAVGVKDLIIVDAPDGVLVLQRGREHRRDEWNRWPSAARSAERWSPPARSSGNE